MTDSSHLVERLLAEGEKTLGFFRALSPSALETTIYADGAQWTVVQILAHFVMAERSMDQLILHILAGGAGTPEDFDLDGYNERRVASLQDESLPALLTQFQAARQVTVELCRRLTPGELDRTGRHPFLGVAPVADILQLMYRHNQIHQREIRKVLEHKHA